MKNKLKKKKKEYSSIKNNIFMIKLIAKICPWRLATTFLSAFLAFFTRVFFSIVFMSFILDAFEQQKSFEEMTIYISIFMLIFLLISLFNSWFSNKYRPLTDQEMNYRINRMVFDKATNIDISCYENPDFYNTYTTAVSEANNRAVSILDNISNITSALISASYLLYKMLSLDFFVALFMIIPIAGTLSYNRYYNKLNYKHYMEDVPYNRKKDYVNRTMFLKKFAKEIRLSKIFNVLSDSYEDSYKNIFKNIDKYKKKYLVLTILQGLVSYQIVFECAWLYIAYKVIVSKTLSASDYIILATAIVNSTTMIIDLIGNISQSANNGLYINNLRKFLNYKEKISEDQDGIIPNSKNFILELKNVSFVYEGQTEPVLKNISFRINSTEKFALVGHNGAGKTTLVKLLMRLYDVTEGEILLNGINIKKYNLKAYRKLYGTVFQDYQILSMSVLENVRMNTIENDEQRKICEDALKKSGLYQKVTTLKNGVDTTLTREHNNDGAVLSGGEFQKVAISRVFAKDSNIMILDEPSSALDPIAEYEMYETLSGLYSEKDKDKMVILISHRLSSAVMADKVILLEQGEIAESGTHKELLSINGKYAELFLQQAKNYIK
ncbi:MAG TPA: ABC transporter ATP-binding protein [Clostridiales bacterium]|nr:ABC transporter ATP-binding protein [Clostridiales bacterium]